MNTELNREFRALVGGAPSEYGRSGGDLGRRTIAGAGIPRKPEIDSAWSTGAWSLNAGHEGVGSPPAVNDPLRKIVCEVLEDHQRVGHCCRREFSRSLSRRHRLVDQLSFPLKEPDELVLDELSIPYRPAHPDHCAPAGRHPLFFGYGLR